MLTEEDLQKLRMEMNKVVKHAIEKMDNEIKKRKKEKIVDKKTNPERV